MGLTVTESAALELQRVLTGMCAPEGHVLRLHYDDGDVMRLQVGKQQKGDQIINHDGSAVLAIPGPVNQALSDTTLDFEPPPEGRGFVLD